LGSIRKNITKIEKIHTSQVGSFGRTLLDAGEFNEESLGYIISYGDLMGVLQEEIECISNVKTFYETKVTKCIDEKASLNLSLQTNNKIKNLKVNLLSWLMELPKKLKGWS